MKDFEELKQNLIETCGFSCYFDAENCVCFGVATEEMRKETNTTLEEAEEDAFYKIEDCPYFDSMAAPTGYLYTAPRDKKGRAFPCYDLSPLKLITYKEKT